MDQISAPAETTNHNEIEPHGKLSFLTPTDKIALARLLKGNSTHATVNISAENETAFRNWATNNNLYISSESRVSGKRFIAILGKMPASNTGAAHTESPATQPRSAHERLFGFDHSILSRPAATDTSAASPAPQAAINSATPIAQSLAPPASLSQTVPKPIFQPASAGTTASASKTKPTQNYALRGPRETRTAPTAFEVFLKPLPQGARQTGTPKEQPAASTMKADTRPSQSEFVQLLQKQNPYLSKKNNAAGLLGELYAGTSKYNARELVFGKKSNAQKLNAWMDANGAQYGLSISADLSTPDAEGLYHVYITSAAQQNAGVSQGADTHAGYILGSRTSTDTTAALLGTQHLTVAVIGRHTPQISDTSELEPKSSSNSPIYALSSSSFTETEYARKYLAPPSTVAEAKEHAVFWLLSMAKVTNYLPESFDIEKVSAQLKVATLGSINPAFWANLGVLLVYGSASMEEYGLGSKPANSPRSALKKNIMLAQERQEIGMEGLKTVLNEYCGFKPVPSHEQNILSYTHSNGANPEITTGPIYVQGAEIPAETIALLNRGQKLPDADAMRLSNAQFNNFITSLSQVEIAGAKPGQALIAEWSSSNIIQKNDDGSYALLNAKDFNSKITARNENNANDPIVRALYVSRGIKIIGAGAQALSLEIRPFVQNADESLTETTLSSPIKNGTDVYVELSANRILENGEFNEKDAEFDYEIVRYTHDSQSRAWSDPTTLSKEESAIVELDGKKYIKFTAGSKDAAGGLYLVQARAKNGIGMQTETVQAYVGTITPNPKQPFPHVYLPLRQNREESVVIIPQIISQLTTSPGAAATFTGYLKDDLVSGFLDSIDNASTNGLLQTYNWLADNADYRQNWVNALGSEANYQAFWNALTTGKYGQAYNLIQEETALKNAFHLDQNLDQKKINVRKLAQEFSYDVLRYGATLTMPVIKDESNEDVITIGVSIANTQANVSLGDVPMGTSKTMSYGANIAWIPIRKDDLKTLFGIDATQVREKDVPVSYIISARSSASINLSRMFSASALTIGSREVPNGSKPVVRGLAETTINASIGRLNLGAGPLANFSDLQRPEYGITVPASLNLGSVTPYLRFDYAGKPVIYGGITFAIPGTGGTTVSAYTQRESRR